MGGSSGPVARAAAPIANIVEETKKKTENVVQGMVNLSQGKNTSMLSAPIQGAVDISEKAQEVSPGVQALSSSRALAKKKFRQGLAGTLTGAGSMSSTPGLSTPTTYPNNKTLLGS